MQARSDIDRDDIEEPGKPLAPFGRIAANAPERVQICCESQSLQGARFSRPCERGSQVVVLARDPGKPCLLFRSHDFPVELRGQRDEAGQMRTSPLRFLATVAQAI